MKEVACRFARLIDVKSIVTLLLTIGFLILSLKGNVTSDQFLTVFTVIIAFYFGTQYQKGTQDNKAE